MKAWSLGGTWLVLEGKECEGVDLLDIGYKYNSVDLLAIGYKELVTQSLGGRPGEAYEARWTDKHGNTHSCKIAHPAVISQYFVHSNCIDKHNHACQAELKLEKKWVTIDGYF
eukprot:scaffold73172_cov59-Attheya_sp.AAC.4